MRLLLLICSILSIQTLVVLGIRNKQVNLKIFDERDLPFSNQTEPIIDPIIEKQLTELFTEELKTLLKEKEGKRFEKHLNPLETSNESKVLRRRQTQVVDTDSRVNANLLSSPTAREIDAQSTLGIKVAQKLAENGAALKQSNIQAPEPFCPFKTNIFCNQNTRFSSLDGSCNNLQSPWFGKAETPYKRYFTPSYDDAINSPRNRAKSGNQLPNPRVISRTLFNENFQFESSTTNFFGIFGQFLAHDITSASLSSEAGGKSIDCSCNNQNPACMSINMPSNENIMRMSCMRFTRSSAAFASFDCRLGHREQLNLLTSFIDGTQIYGPSEGRARELRSFTGGQLRTSSGVGTTRPFLPQAQDGACRNTDQRVKCFAAGEGRVNENLALTSLQTLFTREHNRVAQELARINPQWDENRLFQEARKIVIAELQHITYHEWVPTVVGWNTAALFDLVPLSTNTYFTGYNSEINPQLANEFAAAAFRFGHTMIRNQFGRFDRNNQKVGNSLVLSDIIFRPVEAYNEREGGLDSILLGLVNEASSKFDTNFPDTLQNRLFEFRLSDNSVIAVDLGATNINRGRDHGIPPYNQIREKCGFRRAKDFNDLSDSISRDKINSLASVYENVEDIDFYVGGLSETPMNGAIVGPTFACIIANQFKDLKKGDRFYYENGPSLTAFTLDQLAEIKKVSMSRIICDNTDIDQIQPNAFMMPSSVPGNNRISCTWIKDMDLSKWKE